ncbi:MAG: carboxypeptidase-like regulatory domain-containing protein [Flammeovirgaceae bacterium]|nr:carboxypeptidase-like regulatory domain-containing protein [Flammeovirgaceae bacterium]
MKKIALSLIAVLLIGGTLSAQDRTITGKVTASENGRALPGVNVILKGTTKGTVTDYKGNYILQVPAKGGTLVFSFIGLATQEVPIVISNRIDVVMVSDVAQLSEAVVTEYDKQELKPINESVAGVRTRGVGKIKKDAMYECLLGKMNFGNSPTTIPRSMMALTKIFFTRP